MQYYLDCVQVELAEDWVEVVETEMRYVHLHFVVISRSSSSALVLIWRIHVVQELLLDFEEAFLYLLLDFRPELLLSVEHLHFLLLEVLQGVAPLFFLVLEELVDRLRDIQVGVRRIVASLAMLLEHAIMRLRWIIRLLAMSLYLRKAALNDCRLSVLLLVESIRSLGGVEAAVVSIAVELLLLLGDSRR